MLETSCKHAHKVVHTEDFGQVSFTIDAQPGRSISLRANCVVALSAQWIG
jgi:hypothetical protein